MEHYWACFCGEDWDWDIFPEEGRWIYYTWKLLIWHHMLRFFISLQDNTIERNTFMDFIRISPLSKNNKFDRAEN